MEKLYNVTEFADMIGKSVKTLQRWDREGILTAYRSPSKRRYYTHTQYLEYIGEKGVSSKINVIYARVSTKNQQDDLLNQLEFLKRYSINNKLYIQNKN
jgi:predicted site-specific integrase-resolvase